MVLTPFSAMQLRKANCHRADCCLFRRVRFSGPKTLPPTDRLLIDALEPVA
jgi:hypothetical protein